MPNSLYYCYVSELQEFCHFLNISIYVLSTRRKKIKKDTKYNMIDNIKSVKAGKSNHETIYQDWALEKISNYMTFFNFNYSLFDTPSKAFKLADDIWKKTKPITLNDFTLLYHKSNITFPELANNNSNHKTWKHQRLAEYENAKRFVYN